MEHARCTSSALVDADRSNRHHVRVVVGAHGGVGSWIERRARIAPDQPALVHGDVQRTYGELASRVQRLSGALSELGVHRGDRVLWLGASHPAFLELLFATARLGAVLAPVNHRLDHSTIGAMATDYAADVAFVGADAVDVPLAMVRARVVVGAASGSDLSFEHLVARGSSAGVAAEVHLDDVCLLPHTSGTTGTPKGVMLTHGNVTWNVINLLSMVDFRSDDVTIAIAPFFRTGGTGVNVLPVLFKGGTVVIPEGPDPDDIVRLLEEHRVTIGFANPDLLDAMLRTPRWTTADLASIRYFITGGAPVPERLLRTYAERGLPLLQGYGLSEAAPFVLLLDAPSALRKVGSAGKPPLFVDVRVVRPDGTTCAPDEAGELHVRGPNVMAGYWNREEATRATLDDGWLHTGDAARVDDEGYVWIVDRVADAFESAGHVVYPGDVERVLGDHPAVVDAGIVAHGGGSTAFVVLAPGAATDEQELLECCRERLAPHEVPTAVVLVDRLPRSSVGKLLRHELLHALDAEARPTV
jgi:fatty-acyl-CoA synthase